MITIILVAIIVVVVTYAIIINNNCCVLIIISIAIRHGFRFLQQEYGGMLQIQAHTFTLISYLRERMEQLTHNNNSNNQQQQQQQQQVLQKLCTIYSPHSTAQDITMENQG